jgi:hypothetical protein
MDFELAAELPVILPRAIAWAEDKSKEALSFGLVLDARGISIARRVGVASPERIRVMLVDRIPRPEDPDLLLAATKSGLIGPDGEGITFGYGTYLVARHNSEQLLAHECRHVFQYEAAGSIAAFLPKYLQQIAEFGYAQAPYEIDACLHEEIVV